MVLFLPFMLLLVATLRNPDTPQPVLAGAVAAEAFLAFGLLREAGLQRITVNTSAIPLYLIGIIVLWITKPDLKDWFLHMSMGVMSIVPLTLYGIQEWFFTGRFTMRRAKALINRLLERTEWPDELLACKSLPEVRALRAVLQDDAEPALDLLLHPKPQVRIAALAALEFRTNWLPGQPEVVLRAAKFATEPMVRAAAIMALANVDNPSLLMAVTSFLRDSSPDVRRATAEALLWDADRRWGDLREGIRRAMADIRCSRDGPLACAGSLPDQAISDLKMWAGESGPIAGRSILTLVAHYRRMLQDNASEELVRDLIGDVVNGKIPSAFQLELAHLLQEFDCLTPTLLEPLLLPARSSGLRLLATGALLKLGPHSAAVETLRELARLPNREMTLAAAQIIQQQLRVDMGLAIAGELPDPQSKQAADVARRVLRWAQDEMPEEPITPPPPRRSSRRPILERPEQN